MSQSGVATSAAAGVQGASGNTGPGATGGLSGDEFLALLAQVIAPPALAAEDAPPALAAQDAAGDDVPVDPALAAWPLGVPLPVPAGPLPPAGTATGAPGESASDPLQALAPVLDGRVPALPAANEAARLVSPDDPMLDADASADGSEAPGALAAPAPRVEAGADGRETLVVRRIEVPVGHPRWAESVGHEVRLLVERGLPSATLKLSPEHLGPVEVRIDLSGDKANVWFGAAHADTRAALTDAIPRLREMFAGAGLTLGDTGVRQDMSGRAGTPGHAGGFAGPAGSDGAVVEVPAVDRLVRVGLVDAYA